MRYRVDWPWALALTVLWMASQSGCGGAQGVRGKRQAASRTMPSNTLAESPPESSPYRDVKFPWIERSVTASGLEVNSVPISSAPVVDIRLVIRGGRSQDPAGKIGLAQLAIELMKEGTRRSTSEAFARRVDHLGAQFNVGCSDDAAFITMHALEEHLDEALALMAEVITSPRMDRQEFEKLKNRENDRLAMDLQDPNYLASKAFYKTLYGTHPYANVDLAPSTLKSLSVEDIKAWHQRHVLPRNSFLVIASRLPHAQTARRVEKAFAAWKNPKTVDPPATALPPPATHDAPTQRRVVLVDRPGSVQSVILIGNLAMPRASKDFVPFMVTNQVLGGSAASRLFLDLREKRSLTYGAYSGLVTRLHTAPFKAYASVRTEVSTQALEAFLEHLQRMTLQVVPEHEFKAAQRYVADSFPLKLDTSAEIAAMVSELRTYGLPDDTWDFFRRDVMKTTAEQGLALAKRYIHAKDAIIVVVGEASHLREPLKRFGKVEEVSPKDL